MPIFFLSSENCDFAKRLLRARLPEVKSSHLTEALAAAFGFRTHAALLAAIKSANTLRLPLVEVDVSRFGARLRELGYPSLEPAGLVDVLRAPDLPLGVWREVRSGDIAAINAWFRDCERRNIPNIYIELRTKYAKVSWDCICIDKADEDHVRDDRASALVETMFRRYQALAKDDPAKSEFFGSAFVGRVDRVSPPVARELADEFFLQLYTPMAARVAA